MSMWPSWASVPNKPTVSVDVKQHSANESVRYRPLRYEHLRKVPARTAVTTQVLNGHFSVKQGFPPSVAIFRPPCLSLTHYQALGGSFLLSLGDSLNPGAPSQHAVFGRETHFRGNTFISGLLATSFSSVLIQDERMSG